MHPRVVFWHWNSTTANELLTDLNPLLVRLPHHLHALFVFIIVVKGFISFHYEVHLRFLYTMLVPIINCHILNESIMCIIKDIVYCEDMAYRLEHISRAWFDLNEWLIRKSEWLCNCSNDYFHTNDHVIYFLWLFVVEISKHLKYVKQTWLPVWKEHYWLHA